MEVVLSFTLKYCKVHKNAKAPERANPSDAGADVFWCPSDLKERPERTAIICSNQNVMLETGIKIEVPHGYMIQGLNKSGIAVKKGLVLGACVVDSGYSGEIFVDLHNIGNGTQIVKAGDKIAQLVLVPIVPCLFEEVKYSDLYKKPNVCFSNRGEGALGSTGSR